MDSGRGRAGVEHGLPLRGQIMVPGGRGRRGGEAGARFAHARDSLRGDLVGSGRGALIMWVLVWWESLGWGRYHAPAVNLKDGVGTEGKHGYIRS